MRRHFVFLAGNWKIVLLPWNRRSKWLFSHLILFPSGGAASSSGSLNESTDTPYDPVGGSQGLQDVHGLLLLVPGVGGGGARSQPMKYSASGSLNESADTTYCPVGGPYGPQEVYGKHLFVPGAGPVGQIKMTHG